MDNNQKKGKNFLSVYIIGLFGIALVLILISYATQLRADSQLSALDSKLNEQVNAVQGANARVEALQATLADQEETIQALEAEIEEYRESLGLEDGEDVSEFIKKQEARIQALDEIWKLEKRYVAGDTATAGQLLARLENTFGTENLPELLGDGAYQEYILIKEALSEGE